MRVRFSILVLLFFSLVFFILINSNFTMAVCNSHQDCIDALGPNYYCDQDGDCVQSVCKNGFKEPNEVCDSDSDCAPNEKCNSDCSACVASFSANGVCEYGAGEIIGDNYFNGKDDCDQDNDKLYDHCGYVDNNGHKHYDNAERTCNDVVYNNHEISESLEDQCPNTDESWAAETSTLRNSMNYEDYYDSNGCSCDQNTCTAVTFDCTNVYDSECINPDSITMTCTDSHPNCYDDSDKTSVCNSLINNDGGDCTVNANNDNGFCGDGYCLTTQIYCSYDCSQSDTDCKDFPETVGNYFLANLDCNSSTIINSLFEQCNIPTINEGTSCTVTNQPGTCNADGDCIPNFVCTEGNTTCDGNQFNNCTNNDWVLIESCPNLCDNSTGCYDCNVDNDCNDNNDSTRDTCSSGNCQHSPITSETTCEENHGFCSDSSVTNANAIQGVCSSGSCYSCNDSFTLENGVCVPDVTCTNECPSQGSSCVNGVLTECGDFDSDNCLDLRTSACDYGCFNNACIGCDADTWSPATNESCVGVIFTQTNDCGGNRNNTGTLEPSYPKDPSEVDCGQPISSENNCGLPIMGTYCSPHNTCVDNSCVPDCPQICSEHQPSHSFNNSNYCSEGSCYVCDISSGYLAVDTDNNNKLDSCSLNCGDETACDGVCVDTSNDFDNCGNCSNSCADDSSSTIDYCENSECHNDQCVIPTFLELNYIYTPGSNLTIKLDPIVRCAGNKISLKVNFTYSTSIGEIVDNYGELVDNYLQVSGSDIPTSKNDVDLQELTVDVSQGDKQLFESNFNFLINCSGQCCQENSYWAPTIRCYLGDGTPGTCGSEGECKKDCGYEPDYTKNCEDNSVVTRDACGTFINEEDCSSDELCRLENDTPSCVPKDSCTYKYEFQCSNNRIVKVDTGCGNTSVQSTCDEGKNCVMELNRPTCKLSCGSKTDCNDKCVSLQSDFNNCGECNNKCDKDEQCIEGSCQAVDQCLVVCSRDDDCAEDEICLNPGSCQLSQCSLINVKEQTDEDLQAISAELVETKSIGVNYFVKNGKLFFEVKNYLGVQLTNVSFQIDVSEALARTANSITIDGVNYKILKIDPVLEINIPFLNSKQEFTLDVGKHLDRTYVNYISVSDIKSSRFSVQSLEEKWRQTKEVLDLGIDYQKTKEGTKVKLALRPQANLKGVSIPVQIPKCMAQYADELILKGNYKIVQDDPLIVWQFDEVKEQQSIEFTVPKDISDDCKQQLRAIGLAQSFSKPLNPFLPLLIIPVLALLLVFYGFAGHQVEHMSKEEFFQTAKDQAARDGQVTSKEDLERSWHDYKRRF